MTRFRRIVVFGLSVILAAAVMPGWIGFAWIAAARATTSPLVAENTFLSVQIDGKPYRLQALVMREAARAGRLPVALITHGQSAEIDRRDSLDAQAYTTIAREFARRGWLSVVVVRRGFGKSQGPTPYVLRGCSNGNYGAIINEQTDDIVAAMQAVAKRGDADPDRVLAFGGSVGGAVMLNLAARAPRGLRAAINVSGGVASRPRDPTRQPSCRPEHLLPVFADYGKRSRIPTLWLYAENDSLFPGDYVRGLHAAYVAGGGVSTFHMFEPLGKDGHTFFSTADGLARALPAIDAFLQAQKLPTYDGAPLDGALKSALSPAAASYFANLYRGRPVEKALALAANGRQGYIAYGRANPDQAAKDSVAGCQKQGREPCRVVLQNFDVVPAQ